MKEREKQQKKHAPSIDLGENLSFGGIIVSSMLAITTLKPSRQKVRC
jgi:hypothetical protein